jgi:anti-sigma B factor antagonist
MSKTAEPNTGASMVNAEDRGTPREFGVQVTEGSGGETLVSVAGEVDVYTAPRLRDCLYDLIGQGKHDLVIDFAEMDFIDSTGLGVLVGALKRLRQAGGDLALRRPSRATYKILEITGLTKVFKID